MCKRRIIKIELLKRATPESPDTLRNVIPRGGFTDQSLIHGYGEGYWVGYFEKDRKNLIGEVKHELKYIKYVEEKIRGETRIVSADVVSQLKKTAKWAGSRKGSKMLSNMPADLYEKFTQEQINLLYKWLIEVEESCPQKRWRSVRFTRTLNLERKRKLRRL